MDNLETINEAGTPPESRIKDALSAYNIWNTIRLADATSSLDRAMIDSAYDNEKPLDDDKLLANNQGYRVNVSWGWMDMVLETAMAGYVDIFSAVDNLFECPTNYGLEAERSELEQVVAKEVSDCMRSWPDFYWNYLRLCSTFIKHGVSIALMDDESDWRWTATDMSDFKLPRKTKIGQENITVAACLRFYSATDLYRLIKNPKVAEDLGYNVEAIQSTIRDTVNRSNGFRDFHGADWEKLEAELRNNDVYFSNGAADVEMARVVHLYVKEFDEKITHIMIDDKQDRTDFLYRKIGRYDNIYQAFIMFVYGVGTNGLYHGVRGQGYKVFPTNGALNVAACQMLENATYGSAITLQPRDETAMQDLQFLPTGPFNLISPGIEVLKDSVLPNVSQNSISVLQTFSQMFRDRTSQYNTESLLNSSVEKTKYQVQSETGAVSKMSISALNLFYVPFELLIREMVRRMYRKSYSESEPGGKYIAGLKKRLLQRGENGFGDKARYWKAFLALDCERLTVTKAIGSGSEQARMLIFDRLMSLYGTFPDTGKEALVWDITAASAGFRNAARYAARPGGIHTPTVDVSIAQLENNILFMGGSIEVVDGQNDFAHARTHLQEEEPKLQQAEEAIATNNIEAAAQLLPGINALNAHAAQHVDRLSQDPLMKEESASMRQVLQQADEVLHNGILKVQKAMQQAQSEQMMNGEQQQGGPKIDPVELAKMEGERMVRQAKLQWAKEEHDQKLVLNQQKAHQEMYLKDVEMADKIKRGVRA